MKYLMIIVVLLEELLNKMGFFNLSKNSKSYIFKYSLFTGILILILMVMAYFNVIMLQAFIISCYASITFTAIILIAEEWVKHFVRKVLLFIIVSGAILGMMDSKELSQETDVTLTSNIVKYKGITENVAEVRGACDSNLFTITHYRKSLLGFQNEGIRIGCVETPSKSEEIQEIN